MKQKTHLEFEVIEQARHEAELDVVVPFTTPDLTRIALDAANRMSAGLNATLRLIKIQVVPFPLAPDESPIFIDFLKSQLSQVQSKLPVAREIRLAREFETGLLATLEYNSITVLATRRRPWRTRNERLAAALRRAGHKVALICAQGVEDA